MMNFLTGLGGKLLVLLGIVTAALSAIALLRKSGSDAERAKELEKVAASRRTSDAVREKIDNATPSDLERLRQQWTR